MFILPEQSHDMWLMPLSSRTPGIALRQQLSSISYGSIKRIKQQYFRNARKSTIRLYLKFSLNLSLIRNPWAWCPSFGLRLFAPVQERRWRKLCTLERLKKKEREREPMSTFSPPPVRDVYQLNSATICQQVARASPTLTPTSYPGQGHHLTRNSCFILG